MPGDTATSVRPGINTGAGRTLAAMYALFALAATGRSAAQLVADASAAPLAYGMSAVAAIIYLVATACFVAGNRARRIAIAACTFELAGVLIVGLASYRAPDLFPDRTVWSHFGQGYGFIPVALPAIGLWWLLRAHKRQTRSSSGVVP